MLTLWSGTDLSIGTLLVIITVIIFCHRDSSQKEQQRRRGLHTHFHPVHKTSDTELHESSIMRSCVMKEGIRCGAMKWYFHSWLSSMRHVFMDHQIRLRSDGEVAGWRCLWGRWDCGAHTGSRKRHAHAVRLSFTKWWTHKHALTLQRERQKHKNHALRCNDEFVQANPHTVSTHVSGAAVPYCRYRGNCPLGQLQGNFLPFVCESVISVSNCEQQSLLLQLLSHTLTLW